MAKIIQNAQTKRTSSQKPRKANTGSDVQEAMTSTTQQGYQKAPEQQGAKKGSHTKPQNKLQKPDSEKVSVTLTDKAPKKGTWRDEAPPSDAVAAYLRDISAYPLLTRQQEAALSKRALEKDEAAQEQLVTSNLRLVVSICKDFTRGNFALLDLVSPGNEGLMVAARKYDWRMGVPFANYAAYWIKQRVMKYVAEHGFYVRVPPYRAAIVNKVVRAHTRLVATHGRGVSDDDVAQESGCTKADVSEVLRMMQPAMELDSTVPGGEGGATFGSYFGESSEEADERLTSTLHRMDLILAIKGALSMLKTREAQVLSWYYGLEGAALTLDEIAVRLGVTRERARQIKADATKALEQNKDLRDIFFQ